jgi:alcohol dehydrogenase class IV
MKFKFHIGTKVFFGKDCIRDNSAEFSKLGKKAFIVTGRSSARRSGALDDIMGALGSSGIEYIIFDKIDNNPSLENVCSASREARLAGADFVIGAGGGSPLDAAKAVAVLATNNIEPLVLFGNSFSCKPLPVAAVPTTAGTGSEVTPYSILTRHDLKTKMSFGNEMTFPSAAFLDARYTLSLSPNVEADTAIDALTHAIEGHLGKKSTPATDLMAAEAIRLFGECSSKLLESKLDFNDKEKLLYASMLAGMVISHTGTTIIHGMGYSLTYYKGLSHGRANGLLIKEYLKFNYEQARDKVDNILNLLGYKDISMFGCYLDNLLGMELKLSSKEISDFAALTMLQRSTSNNIRIVQKEDLEAIFRSSFGE